MPLSQWFLIACQVTLVMLLCLYLQINLGMVGRGGYDHINFHAPTIHAFANQWPHPQFDDYLSATTPGYHILLAIVGRYLGLDPLFYFSFAITAMLLTIPISTVAFGLWAARTKTHSRFPLVSEWLLGTVVVLPLIASPYVLASGVWLLPDNLAWLLVLLTIRPLLAGIVQTKNLVFASVFLLLLVSVRQIHLWAAAPVIMAAYCAPKLALSRFGLGADPVLFLLDLKNTIFRNPPKQLLRASLAALLTLPSVLLLLVVMTHDSSCIIQAINVLSLLPPLAPLSVGVWPPN